MNNVPKAKKLPSGSWRVQVSTGQKKNGKYVYKSFTAPTKKEAEYLGSEFLYKRKNCEKGSDPVFSKAAESYLETKEYTLSLHYQRL